MCIHTKAGSGVAMLTPLGVKNYKKGKGAKGTKTHGITEGETERCSRIFTKPEKACAGMPEAFLTHHTENADLLVITSPVS